MSKKKRATLTREQPKFFDGKKWNYETERFQVEVMAVSGIWAMVRRKGCVPSVVRTSCLSTADDSAVAP